MTIAYLCLGSNIKPEDHIQFAVARLKRDFSNVTLSNVYKSAAVGFNGDDFLNLAVAVQTDLSLGSLLYYAGALEQEAGRVRVQRGRYDSRTLDVDVVMYGDFAGQCHGRAWPSDDIDKEAHVLLPLSEITVGHKHPRTRMEFTRLWADFDKGAQPPERVDLAFDQ